MWYETTGDNHDVFILKSREVAPSEQTHCVDKDRRVHDRMVRLEVILAGE